MVRKKHTTTAMSTSDIAFLRKLAEIKRSGQFKISMEQLRRLDHIKQGQFTATITEEEEALPPRFQTNIKDTEVGPTSYSRCESQRCSSNILSLHFPQYGDAMS